MNWPYYRGHGVEAGVIKAADAYEVILHVRRLRLSVNVWLWREGENGGCHSDATLSDGLESGSGLEA